MDVDQCIATYTSIFETIFKKPKYKLPIDFTGRIQGRCDSKLLRKAMNEVAESRDVSPTEAFVAKRDRACRT